MPFHGCGSGVHQSTLKVLIKPGIFLLGNFGKGPLGLSDWEN